MHRSPSMVQLPSAKQLAMTPAQLNEFRINRIANIAEFNEEELQVFIRKRGGYSKLSSEELNAVVKRKFSLNPQSKEPFLKVRKHKKLEEMKQWAVEQANAYLNSLPLEQLDCDELTVLNAILAQNQVVSPPLNKKYIRFSAGYCRWPAVDFFVLDKDDIDDYMDTFLFTNVEARLIAKRMNELDWLESVDSCDKEEAITFVCNLCNKDSLTSEQWCKISRKIGLPVNELLRVIKPIDAAEEKALFEEHARELREIERLRNSKNEVGIT